ncbi:hypothetical protein Ait01nite_077740 [Actinoplanes italicus]|uniref:Uncharacterized protein n=1 Tax=Actinoplanes italicus TaxID=113567 RepID=A0A2T0K3X8_9ACTN|nr:hypothetical protein [Actinoplanes italicus]PRX17587.1 hypothetical protein CLV67_11579 [Actinoplanes italicus]GIE34729.1 hypothetical protein Ait01nite_077740 [Actinoplanes italicus]
MRSLNADGKARLLSWRRVREFAVPASMIETATARRHAGDWAGASAAAQVDVDLDLREIASLWGRELAALVRADLRRLAPDLLRWHLPRTLSDGLLRPGLTISLARYSASAGDRVERTGRHPVAEDCAHLVVRTAPSWADSGQRISLALWDPAVGDAGPHPRPQPDRRFRLDLHPHLWAADRAHDLRERCGADEFAHPTQADRTAAVPDGRGYAAHRWAAEAAILRAADGYSGPVAIRLGNGRRVLLSDGEPEMDTAPRRGRAGRGRGEAVLPYAATWLAPDLELLQSGMITADLLHPLVAEALASRPDRTTIGAADTGPATAEVRAKTVPSGQAKIEEAEKTADPGQATIQAAGKTVTCGEVTTEAGGMKAVPRQVPTEAGGMKAVPRQVTPEAAGERAEAQAGATAATDDGVRLVECCGAVHRVGLVGGRLVPLDHDAEELRREELLALLGGPPLPCLRSIRTAARNPECLEEVRARLDHGDHAGASALVAELLGPEAKLEGALGEAFAAAAEGRIAHGLYRAGLAARVPAGVTVPIGSRKERHGRRGRHHRLPKRTTRTATTTRTTRTKTTRTAVLR